MPITELENNLESVGVKVFANKTSGGSVAEWFVHLTTKLASRVRSGVAAGLPTDYSVLGCNLAGYCFQQYRPRLDNRGGNDVHRGLCWI